MKDTTLQRSNSYVPIPTGILLSGTYQYALQVDGIMVATKQMVVMK